MSGLKENIRRFRIEKGFKQTELGDLLGKAPSVIANWEAGTNRPDVVSIENLCNIFGVDANTIFGWDSIIGGKPITPMAQRIAFAYDLADLPVKRTVYVALEPYMEEPVLKKTNESQQKSKKAPSRDDDPPMMHMAACDPNSNNDTWKPIYDADERRRILRDIETIDSGEITQKKLP